MLQNKRKDIQCPCRACKLEVGISPFTGTLLEHLLFRGFMDGHTRWLTDDDEHDGNDGAPEGNNQDQGQQDNNNEGPEHEEPDLDPVQHDEVEEDDDDRVVLEEEDTRTLIFENRLHRPSKVARR